MRFIRRELSRSLFRPDSPRKPTYMILKKAAALSLLAASVTAASQADACSTILVTQVDNSGKVVNAINARSMDFENQLFYFFGFGAAGTQNMSQVNFFQELANSNDKIATWTNTKRFIGRTAFSKECLVDGINEAGVYAGFLFLPDITEYPNYDPNDPRKAISHSDVVNFILGRASSVTDGLNQLKQFQIVNSASEFTLDNSVKFTVQPLHVVIRDKAGDAALIEYRNGRVNIYHGSDVNVVTNAPFYDWQVNNFRRKLAHLSARNKPGVRRDGLLMNGSGLAALPGSFMPPDRFTRLKLLHNYFPTAKSRAEAMVLAQQGIDNVKAPFGATEAPTIFLTMANLKEKKYFYKGIALRLITEKNGITATLDPAAEDPTAWIVLDLEKLHNSNLPPEFLRMQTQRKTTFIDPNSPKIAYAKGVGARTTYKTTFIPISEFTDKFAKDKLFP